MWNCLSNINYYENKLSKWISSGGELGELDVDFKKICRTCLRDAPDTDNLLSDFEIGAINFNYDGRVLRLIDMLAESTNIEVTDSDSFPHQVCNNCIHNISGAYFYRLQCHKANNLLQRLESVLTQPVENVEPEVSPPTNTMKSSYPNHNVNETFESKHEIGKSISSYFIELKSDPDDPDPIDNVANEEEKNMSVEFDGIQYQIDSEEIFHEDIEDDVAEENQINEGEENQFDESDEDNRLTEMDEENASAPADQVSENIEEQERDETDPNMMLEEISIEILDNRTSNDKTQSSTTNSTNRPRNQRRKGEATTDDFRCELCDAKFTKVQSLKRHVKIHQADQRNKLCSFCGKAFIRADDLTRHIRTHTGERPYGCKLCPKRYKQTSELNEHLLTHSREKMFICPICGNTLQTRNGYYVHMLIHRGEKRHRCDKCGNRYVTSGELNSHKRHIHDKVKPFRCTIGDCDRCFTTKHSLEIHERAHTGERPFKCSICTKCFSAKSSLQDHLRLHFGSAPYKCNICDKSINSYQGLKKHMQGHEARGETEKNQILNDLFEPMDTERSDTNKHGSEDSGTEGFEHLNRSLLKDQHTIENVIEEELYIVDVKK